MKKFALLFLTLSIFSLFSIYADDGHHINFTQVRASELVKFISKITETNFIYNDEQLDFDVSLVTGSKLSSDHVLDAMTQLLKKHELTVRPVGNYFIIEKEEKVPEEAPKPVVIEKKPEIVAIPTPTIKIIPKKENFSFYKLRYHEGAEILENLKQISANLLNEELVSAINTLQWVRATNSLLFKESEELQQLITHLDVPLRQVFIEVLVLETDIRRSLDFGLDWSMGSKYRQNLGGTMGNFQNGRHQAPLASAMQQVNATNTPSGPAQFPIGKGFDLGIIGDIILHKGKSFLTLGALISALELDGKTSIVLNQKIITQDNQESTLFVGDNIPFPGAVVETVGNSQQTTANIEYRDVGVSLKIKPRLGENDIVTLEIAEEITEATNKHMNSKYIVDGIQTSKTNMLTKAHVPDEHFLVLSGMIRSKLRKDVSKVPCLGGVSYLGAAFSKNDTERERKNILIFVRPQIVNSMDDYTHISSQEAANFDQGPLNIEKALQKIGTANGHLMEEAICEEATSESAPQNQE